MAMNPMEEMMATSFCWRLSETHSREFSQRICICLCLRLIAHLKTLNQFTWLKKISLIVFSTPVWCNWLIQIHSLLHKEDVPSSCSFQLWMISYKRLDLESNTIFLLMDSLTQQGQTVPTKDYWTLLTSFQETYQIVLRTGRRKMNSRGIWIQKCWRTLSKRKEKKMFL